MNIAIFASGRGTNFQAIAEAIRKKTLKANIKLLICDNPGAFVLKRAKSLSVKALLINPRDYLSNKDFEVRITRELKAQKIDLLVLAGFMRILSPDFVREFKNRILNIHPALLPSFKGAYAIRDAFDYGVKLAGVTVHLVDEKIDHGPIILQEALRVCAKDTLKSLEKRIHQLEHKIYPQAIKLFLSGKLRIRGRKVLVG